MDNSEVYSNKWPWHCKDYEKFYDLSINWPKMSIITPSYNQGNFIEQTILSVLNQNYPNLEYIIIDGGSTDNTVDIIKKYGKHLTYWISEPDNGQSHAINKGLERCTGDIINWLNSDDWLEPNALFIVANQFIRNPNILVVSGHENHIYEDGSIIEVVGTTLEDKLEATIERCNIAQPSTFFRCKEFKIVSPVPEDLHYVMDGEVWIRFLLMFGQDNLKKINKPLVNFRLHKDSKTVSNSEVNNFLFERSSIITDLHRFISLPNEIINFWIQQVYKTPKLYSLNRNWEINKKFISKRKIRIHFLKKYVNHQLQYNNYSKAKFGLKLLSFELYFGIFMIKSLIKGLKIIGKNDK